VNEKWLTPGDVADGLRVTKMTVYRMLEAGTIPGYRFGRLYRVRPEDLDAYIRASRLSGRAAGTSAPGSGPAGTT
jgi:excisionase family DNA binding protein